MLTSGVRAARTTGGGHSHEITQWRMPYHANQLLMIDTLKIRDAVVVWITFWKQ
jgi:hypothetical protein